MLSVMKDNNANRREKCNLTIQVEWMLDAGADATRNNDITKLENATWKNRK